MCAALSGVMLRPVSQAPALTDRVAVVAGFVVRINRRAAFSLLFGELFAVIVCRRVVVRGRTRIARRASVGGRVGEFVGALVLLAHEFIVQALEPLPLLVVDWLVWLGPAAPDGTAREYAVRPVDRPDEQLVGHLILPGEF